MKLSELLKDVAVLQMHADGDLEISSVVCDSRKAEPGSLFAAVVGFASDGNRFIPMALANGAAVVVTAQKPEGDFPWVHVADDRAALAAISANFYGHPAKRMTMVGVTGTNGKTTVTLLVKHILETVCGAKTGLIGTMGSQIGDQAIPGNRTTPESLELQGLLARMRDAGCKYVVMEVSSHAIALGRVGGIVYDAAAFTNLTEDHLDFHKTMENYAETKAQLFTRCRRAVLNRDDAYCDRMVSAARCPVLTYSAHGDADLRAEDVHLLPDGVRFTACCSAVRAEVALPIPGRFSVYNALTALGLAVSLGVPLSDAARALATAAGVRGRMEVVPTPDRPYTVLIDYAHTPDGLENVLISAKDFCRGRVIAVFGCGGDRDAKKRPIMGKIGVEQADFVILTSDNPRSEDPNAILSDIRKGIPDGKANYEVIENRRAAVRHALDIAEKNDIIVLAGKGHETYQEILGVKRHLDEREIVAEYLAETEEKHG